MCLNDFFVHFCRVHFSVEKYQFPFSYSQKQPPEMFYKKLCSKRHWRRCFLWTQWNFLRTLFSQNTSGWLLLYSDETCKVVYMCCNVLQKLLLILTGLLWKSVRYNSIRPSAKIQTGKLVSIFYKSLSFFWIQYNVSLKCSKIYVIN